MCAVFHHLGGQGLRVRGLVWLCGGLCVWVLLCVAGLAVEHLASRTDEREAGGGREGEVGRSLRVCEDTVHV